MLQPFANTFAPMWPFGGEPHLRDYVIPEILAFRATLEEPLKDRLQEIYLVRHCPTVTFISGKNITAYIRIEAESEKLVELITDIKEKFNSFMLRLGLTARTVVYDFDWLNMLPNREFAKEIRDNSLLVWSRHNDCNYITLKSCIDSFYPQNLDYDESRNKGIFDREALYEFLLSFPKLDWVRMNEAITDAPVNYKNNVENMVYSTAIAHVRIWITEFYLHTPEWLRIAAVHNQSSGFFPNNNDIDRDDL